MAASRACPASATTCATCWPATTPGAALALDYFVYRIVREAGALAAAMGGIDGIVFTAGIGEHSPDDPPTGAWSGWAGSASSSTQAPTRGTGR